MSKKIKKRLARIHATFLIVLFFWMVILAVLMMDVGQQKEYRKRKARKI